MVIGIAVAPTAVGVSVKVLQTGTASQFFFRIVTSFYNSSTSSTHTPRAARD